MVIYPCLLQSGAVTGVGSSRESIVLNDQEGIIKNVRSGYSAFLTLA